MNQENLNLATEAELEAFILELTAEIKNWKKKLWLHGAIRSHTIHIFKQMGKLASEDRVRNVIRRLSIPDMTPYPAWIKMDVLSMEYKRCNDGITPNHFKAKSLLRKLNLDPSKYSYNYHGCMKYINAMKAVLNKAGMLTSREAEVWVE